MLLLNSSLRTNVTLKKNKKMLTKFLVDDKIRKSLEGDEINWSLKIEQIYKLRTSNSL